MQSHQIQDDHLSIQTTRFDSDSVLQEGHKLIGRPKIDIGKFVLVCKGWRPVAERRLYQSIAIGTTRYTYNTSAKKTQASLLLRTLKEQSYLAGLVRELRMLEPSGHQGPDQHLAHAGIISACTQLSHLTLLGFATSKKVLSLLRHSIGGLASLRTLVLVQHIKWSGFDGNHFGLCTSAELLRWMSRWQDIQHVVVLANKKLPSSWANGQVYSTRKGKERAETPAVPGTTASNLDHASGSNQQLLSLPHLRTFTFLQDTMTEMSLQLLTVAAPSLTSLRIAMESAMTAVPTSLTTWASTLQNLSLQHPAQNVLDIGIEAVLNQLSNLRSLRTTSAVIPPHLLPQLTALEVLEYDIQESSHLDTLVEVVPETLQNLRACSLVRVPTASFSPEAMVALERINDACNRRGVTFDSHIDWQAIMDDLEDHDEDHWDEYEDEYWEDDALGYDVDDLQGGFSAWDDGWGQSHITFEVDGQLMHTTYHWDSDEDHDVASLVRQLRRTL